MIRGNLNARKMPLMCKMPWNVIQERDSRYIVPRNGASPDLKGQQRGKGWKIVFVTPGFYVVSWEINVGQV